MALTCCSSFWYRICIWDMFCLVSTTCLCMLCESSVDMALFWCSHLAHSPLCISCISSWIHHLVCLGTPLKAVFLVDNLQWFSVSSQSFEPFSSIVVRTVFVTLSFPSSSSCTADPYLMQAYHCLIASQVPRLWGSICFLHSIDLCFDRVTFAH